MSSQRSPMTMIISSTSSSHSRTDARSSRTVRFSRSIGVTRHPQFVDRGEPVLRDLEVRLLVVVAIRPEAPQPDPCVGAAQLHHVVVAAKLLLAAIEHLYLTWPEQAAADAGF